VNTSTISEPGGTDAIVDAEGAGARRRRSSAMVQGSHSVFRRHLSRVLFYSSCAAIYDCGALLHLAVKLRAEVASSYVAKRS
jgi:hypothetical protein